MKAMRGSVEDKIQSHRPESLPDRRYRLIDESTSGDESESKIIRDGFLDKESSSAFFQWRSKYCILTSEHLTVYRWHSKKVKGRHVPHEKVRNILYRFPLDEVTAMCNIMKGNRHVFFTICTKDGRLDLRVPTRDRDWLTKIQIAVMERKNRMEFVRELKSRTNLFASKRKKHIRRRSFKKNPQYGDGIGITIRNEGESIVVVRLFPEGPAAKKGTLSVGDEVLSVDGINVFGKHAEDVAELIKSRHSHVVLLIRPTADRVGTPGPASFGSRGEKRNASNMKLKPLQSDESDEENDGQPATRSRSVTTEVPIIHVHPPPVNLRSSFREQSRITWNQNEGLSDTEHAWAKRDFLCTNKISPRQRSEHYFVFVQRRLGHFDVD